MAKRLFKAGEKFGPYTLQSYIGGGGNGEVWQCINEADEVFAIKLMKKVKQKSYDRFLDEVYIMEEIMILKAYLILLTNIFQT